MHIFFRKWPVLKDSPWSNNVRADYAKGICCPFLHTCSCISFSLNARIIYFCKVCLVLSCLDPSDLCWVHPRLPSRHIWAAPVHKPNSWTYDFVEVSGHNTERSQTLGFFIQYLHYKPVSNHFKLILAWRWVPESWPGGENMGPRGEYTGSGGEYKGAGLKLNIPPGL